MTDCPVLSAQDRRNLPGLLVKDSLTVVTPGGECRIELCLGDITKLEQSDKVDVIFISAYGGSYSKAVGVMGSLFRNHGIDVSDLEKSHKEEDLRELYSCWWSKPLPEHVPYKRLLCFESKGSTTFSGRSFYAVDKGARGSPKELVSHAFRCLVPILKDQDGSVITPLLNAGSQELVSHAFRCLVPILKDQDGSVITPLLNAGSQGCDECEMLEGMVENAVSWMKAGLPLRLLKIVIFAKVLGPTHASIMLQRADGAEILDVFSRLKDRLENKTPIPKDVKLDYDVYLSYSTKDQAVVDSIQTTLRALKPDIRIFLSYQQLKEDAIWQEEIYEAMTKSGRVITVLSPNYLESRDCVEQYNIALCCNRQAYRNILAPFYVETVAMPTYMGLVQYADCRDDPKSKITNSCQQLVKTLPTRTKEVHGAVETERACFVYDIFVSYSHCDSEAANHIVEVLKKLDPNLRIFYDIQELKTGHAWQQTLYHSIDGSRTMLALLSNNYLKSAVCREEYSLAQLKHLSLDNLKLIPLRIEDLEQEDASFSDVAVVTATPDVFQTTVDEVCEGLVSLLSGQKEGEGEAGDSLCQPMSEATVTDRLNVDDLMEDHRKKTFKHSYNASSLILRGKFPPRCFLIDQQETEDSAYQHLTGEVVLSFHPLDEKYAADFRKILGWAAPKVVLHSCAPSEGERLDQLDKARHVVAFLSPHYVESAKHVEEFHVALWRQRVSPIEAPLLLPVKVQKLPPRPSYFQLVGSVVDLWDPLWPSLELTTPLGGCLAWDQLTVSRGKALALVELAKITLDIMVTARNLPKETEVRVRPALLNPVHVKAQIRELAEALATHTSRDSNSGEKD